MIITYKYYMIFSLGFQDRPGKSYCSVRSDGLKVISIYTGFIFLLLPLVGELSKTFGDKLFDTI
jgi:hypothetical protein